MMHGLMLSAAAALCGCALAVPGPGNAQVIARDGADADPTSPWVTVDDEGRPATTYTPTMTTISGTPTAVNGAPHDLTASVYTWTTWGVISTTTGAPPNPTATSKSNQGTFSRCFNRDGDFAPFCRPSHNSTLLTGNTYYVTWDPDYYNKSASLSNTTYEITVRLDFYNTTASTWDKLVTFDDRRVPASWGFFSLPVDASWLMGETLNNLSISLLAGPTGSQDKTNSVALPVAVAKPALPSNQPTPVPRDKTLFIALPLGLGAFVLLLIGGCIWNKKTRRIELGNIMSRSRNGYTGRKSRSRLLRTRDKPPAAVSIPLRRAEEPTTLSADYHDADYHDMPDIPRRDSDALASLAESPVRGHFHEQPGANAFRDEISRQEDERRNGY